MGIFPNFRGGNKKYFETTTGQLMPKNHKKTNARSVGSNEILIPGFPYVTSHGRSMISGSNPLGLSWFFSTSEMAKFRDHSSPKKTIPWLKKPWKIHSTIIFQ